MPNARLVKPLSIDGVPSDRGQCDWADRPVGDNLIGDRLQIMDRGNVVAVWSGTAWVVPPGTMLEIAASRSAVLTDAGTPLKSTGASPCAVTIENDATSLWSGNEVLCLLMYGTGAVSFTAGSGVTFRRSAPTVAQYGSMAMWRIGPNEWAYLG